MFRDKITISDKMDDILRDYLEGKGITKIAKKHGTSREAIYLELRKLPDWESLKKSNPKVQKFRRLLKLESKKKLVLRLRKRGVYPTAIAKEVNISYYFVRRLLKGTRYDNSLSVKSRRDKTLYQRHLSGETQVKLAREYKMSQSNVARIIKKMKNI
jgi:Mor family transcriptional regulator